MVVGAGGREGRWCFTGTVSLLQDEESGGGPWRWWVHNTECAYLTPLSCSLKNGEDGKFCYAYFTTIKNKILKRKQKRASAARGNFIQCRIIKIELQCPSPRQPARRCAGLLPPPKFCTLHLPSELKGLTFPSPAGLSPCLPCFSPPVSLHCSSNGQLLLNRQRVS